MSPSNPSRAVSDNNPTGVAAPSPDGVMVFDGVCHLCSGAVRLIASMDPKGVIRFAAVQSPYGRRLCEAAGVDPDDPTTFLFFDHGRALETTDAILALLNRLQAPWRWLRVIAVAPRPWREAVYRYIAAHRYRIFGQRTSCMVPSPDLVARFIDEPPSGA